LKLPAEVCRRFALSLPISSLMCGIESRENLRQDLAMAQNFTPITGQDLDELLQKTAAPGRDGKLEPHKTTRFGSAYHFRQHET
jgi:predicted aldo/keto reductase-like oxidoreductase